MPTTASRSDVIDILSKFDEENQHNKTLVKQISQPPKQFHLTTLLVMMWMLFLMTLSPLLAVQLYDPIDYAHKIHTPMFYVFQIPTVILVSALLGPRYGTITILLYLIAGFAGLPVFAGGGGPQYLTHPSSGYLLGYLLAPWAIHRFLIKSYIETGWLRGRSIWMAVAALLGVITIHAVGVAGISAHLLTGDLNWIEATHWVMQLSWPTLIYDFAFSWVAVASVRIARLLFWFCLY